MVEDFGARFWDTVCGFKHLFVFLFVMALILVILSVAALLLGPQREGTFVVIVIDFALLAVVLGVVGYVMTRCD